MVAVAIIAVVGWFVPSAQPIDLVALKGYVDTSIAQSVERFAGTTNFDTLEVEENIIVGDANAYHVIYLGAGDGCAALYATASGTLTTSATSTSFCN